AALGDVTVPGGGPADRRALRIRGAAHAPYTALFRYIADTGRGAALGRARPEGIGRAVVRGPVAALGDVTIPRGRAADRRALRVRGAVGAAPRAGFGQVANAGGGPALGRARLEGVGRAVVREPVAALGDVTVSGGGPADGRALRVGGAVGAAPRAELGPYATPVRAAALGRARPEGIGRAVVRGPVAALGDVA